LNGFLIRIHEEYMSSNPTTHKQTPQVNKRALAVIQRIQTKLLGKDFRAEDRSPMTVQEQVRGCGGGGGGWS
jgi:hypothetical protein